MWHDNCTIPWENTVADVTLLRDCTTRTRQSCVLLTRFSSIINASHKPNPVDTEETWAELLTHLARSFKRLPIQVNKMVKLWTDVISVHTNHLGPWLPWDKGHFATGF